jgi:hypothetical protein
VPSGAHARFFVNSDGGSPSGPPEPGRQPIGGRYLRRSGLRRNCPKYLVSPLCSYPHSRTVR